MCGACVVPVGSLLRGPGKVQARAGLGRSFFVLSRAAALQVPALFELGFVHGPKGAQGVLAPAETFVERQICPNCALGVCGAG